MTRCERRERLEESIANAEYMLGLARDFAGPGSKWSDELKAAAKLAIPQWENRIMELRGYL